MGDGQYKGKFNRAQRQIELMTLAIYECPDSVRKLINDNMIKIATRAKKNG